MTDNESDYKHKNKNMESEHEEVEELSNIDSLSDEGYIIFYVYCNEGVVITRNMDKVNFFLGMKINEVIKICIVDISSVIISESEYFSIYEVKNQTKYFFDLTNKEISFLERNNKVNYANEEIEENDKEDPYKFDKLDLKGNLKRSVFVGRFQEKKENKKNKLKYSVQDGIFKNKLKDKVKRKK